MLDLRGGGAGLFFNGEEEVLGLLGGGGLLTGRRICVLRGGGGPDGGGGRIIAVFVDISFVFLFAMVVEEAIIYVDKVILQIFQLTYTSFISEAVSKKLDDEALEVDNGV